jgi:hypothetical protein
MTIKKRASGDISAMGNPVVVRHKVVIIAKK